MDVRQLKRLKAVYKKLKAMWVRSTAEDREIMIQMFNESIETINEEIEMILLAKEDCLYLDEAV